MVYVNLELSAHEQFNAYESIAPYGTNSSFTDNSKFTYTLANIIISIAVGIYEL